MNMQAGDILLFKGKSLLDKIIQWGTGSVYSHVGICISSKMNLMLEAIAGSGVRCRDIRKLKKKYDIYRVPSTYLYNLNAVISFLVDKLNLRYDYGGVFYLGFLKIFRRKETANKWQKDKDYFCSELITKAFYMAGLDIVPDKKWGVTSPADLATSKILEKINEEEVI